MKNIFIEGIQGTGKTTLLRLLGEALPDYQVYWEGDYSPVELAWCTYMTEAEYEAALAKFPDLEEKIRNSTYQEDGRYIVTYTRILAERREFYEYMEQFEIYNGRRPLEEFKAILLKRYETFSGSGNIFECSFFQNTMEELLLYYDMTEQEIFDFYEELFAPLKDKDFVMVYLHSEQIEENILQIKRERSDEKGTELWYPLMLRYLNETPYGKKHPFESVEDMADHFRRRMGMELKTIEKVLKDQAIVIPAKEYRIEKLIDKITEGKPNRETVAALLEAERIAKDPTVKGFHDVDELLEELDV